MSVMQAARDRLLYCPPVLLAASGTLTAYGATAGHWTSVVRPLLVEVAVAASVTFAVARLIRERDLAVAVSSAAVLLLLVGGPLAQVLTLVVTVWVIATLLARSRHRGPSLVLPAFNVFSWLLLLLAASTAAGAIMPSDLPVGRPARVAASAGSHPSLYILLLDGYPSSDTLLRDFGLDNSSFYEALGSRAFAYDENATTPAARTELTLLSMLGEDVDTGAPPAWSPRTTERRDIRDALQRSPTTSLLRSEGYRLVHLASPIVHTNFVSWDEVVDTGQVSELEIALMTRSPLWPLLAGWVLGQLRERHRATLDAFAAVAAQPRQQVVLAHLMGPHPPFLYGEAPDCYDQGRCSLFEVRPDALGMTDAEYSLALRAQVNAVNDLVLDALDRVIAADPEAIVVVTGDHGARHDMGQPDEWRLSLFAVRGSDAFTIDPGPRDLLRRLLEAQQ